MVRLKANGFQYWSKRFKISIPYGTIKRLKGEIASKLNVTFQFHMVRLKGGQINANNTEEFIFQFHMVRLKECCVSFIAMLSLISIPYGTIKSLMRHS